MGVPTRHVALVAVLLTLLFIVFKSTSLPSRQALTPFTNFPSNDPVPYETGTLLEPEPTSATSAPERANATFIILCRNSDLKGVIQSVRDVEDRFNRHYGYPYVFLNEEPFSEEFTQRLSVLSDAPMEFGLIPADHWYPPSWIDEQKAEDARKKMAEDGIIYGDSLSYRNMCRFNSGFFFRHPLVQKYRYYWRIEPWVRFHCDLSSDPFRLMEDHNKTYGMSYQTSSHHDANAIAMDSTKLQSQRSSPRLCSRRRISGFTISMYEFEATIPTLWAAVKDYAQLHPEHLNPHNALGFISDDDGAHYNLCHFWSNFEIADMDFWRSDVYMTFFEFLDQQGGFYYERWGDAPVHSIAASLFVPRSNIHFFNEIGYEHPPYTHCPMNKERWTIGRCSCGQEESFDYDGYSCLSRWENYR